MKKNKKNIFIIIIIIIVAIAVISNYKKIKMTILAQIWYQQELDRSYVKDFDSYKNDYQKLADFIITYEKNYTNDNKYNSLFIDTTNGIHIYESKNFTVVKLNSNLQKSLNNVYKSFYDEEYSFDTIRYKKDFIFFATDKTYFAIVYSTNDEKPNGYGLEDDSDYNFYVNKLDKNWYTMKGVLRDDIDIEYGDDYPVPVPYEDEMVE